MSDNAAWGVFAAAMGFWIIFIIAIVLVVVVAWWKVFEKAGEDGWKSLVPFLNAYTLTKIAWGNGWFFLIGLASPIPIIGPLIVLAYSLMTCYKLAKSFGKDTGFMIGLFFLPAIFFMILAFGDARYLGIYDGYGYLNPNVPPMGGFPAPWDMFSNKRSVNQGQPMYGQPYPGQPMNGPQGGFQGQPMNGPQGGFQGQPMNGPQGGFQGQPMNGPQGGFQGQPVNGSQDQVNNWNQNHPQ